MERVRKVLVGFSEVIEVVLAIGVAVLLVMDIIGLLPKIGAFWAVRGDAELIKPTFSNVTEVLVFLIARHVILSEATPTDNLISVISIAILFALEYFLSHEGADSSLMADVSKKFHSRRHSRSAGSREGDDSESDN